MVDKDIQLLLRHIQDMIQRCYMQNHPYYSDFLSMEESSAVMDMLSGHREITLHLEGGYAGAERQLLAMTPMDYGGADILPIRCIRIEPVGYRFHDEPEHRDFLGALMHLGINRSMLGDIILKQEMKKGHSFPVAYVICTEKICPFIVDNLTRVKHTPVHCEESDFLLQDYEPALEELTGTVSSERLDAVVAFLTNQSRSKVSALLYAKKVFVNHTLMQNGSYLLKENDVLRIRGYGKYIYQSGKDHSRKGRLVIHVYKYI